ncbi:MAG: hypothetical protein ACI8TQ_002334 [Planctomycetota bacterium]|jgi:hypothetical protein
MPSVIRLIAPCFTCALLCLPLKAQEALVVGTTSLPDVSTIEGIDEDGRVERPEMPSDIKNPEHWRYTPPGRIIDGNIFERFLISTFFSPLLFFEKDVGTGAGVAITDIDFRNQKYREFAGIVMSYTTEGQQAYTVNWRRWLHHRELENGGIIREDRSILSGGLGFSKTLTRRFFGLGSRSPLSNETSYSHALSNVGVGVRVTVPDPGDDVILGAAINYQRNDLARGRVSSLFSTDDRFPDQFAAADDISQLWLNWGIAYDTRDSLHQPYRGSRIGFSSQTAVLQSNGEFGGGLAVDSQKVFPLPPLFHKGGNGDEENPPTDVIVIGGVIADTHGVLPFYDLPSLGGNTLRGYTPNRFTDRAAAYGTLEYRFGVISRGFKVTHRIRVERINLALFYDFGTVANGLNELGDGEYLDSVGFGTRISFSREASFRIDYGISDEGSNLSIGFGNTL